MAGEVNLQISKDIIAPIVEQKIKESLIEALGGGQQLIEKFIEKVLYDQVNDKGVKSNYSGDNKYNWIDIAVRDAVQKSAQKAVVELLNDRSSEIVTAIKSCLSKKGNAQKFAVGLIDGLIKASESNWKFEMKFMYNERY